jgi:hypothetical protein
MSSAKIILAAHDAGGAEILSSWALAFPRNQYRFRLEGPALAVFRAKMGSFVNLDAEGLRKELDRDPPDLLLTGTSWQSDLERETLALARTLGIRTAAYLDHWLNYQGRFGENWRDNLPDEVWCPDPESVGICEKSGFPPDRLVLKGNPYLDDMVLKMALPGASSRKGRILYVCEPIREHMQLMHGDPFFLGYDQYTSMRHFFRSVSAWAERPTSILVRPHPSEERAKYDAFLDEFRSGLTIERSAGTTLAQEINEAEMVAGCESMALVVALKMGKTVYTSVPPEGMPCRLPFPAIRRIDSPGRIATAGHK